LLGRLSRLVEFDHTRQLMLFDEGGVESERRLKLARVRDDVRAKLGRDGTPVITAEWYTRGGLGSSPRHGSRGGEPNAA
jgi:hypothetical protein